MRDCEMINGVENTFVKRTTDLIISMIRKVYVYNNNNNNN